MADRVTQLATEAVVLPTSDNARVSQLATEAVVLPTNETARLSQLAVEVLSSAPTRSFIGEPGGSVW